MVDLLEAYDEVVSSSTDIIKNNQRNLYMNMFDLLTTTTRAASVSSKVTISDDICSFWYSDILPICFDDDRKIQNSAIESLDTFVKNIDSIQFYNSSKWPQLKQQIVDNYIEKLNKMRDNLNVNWYKIWCLLIRILNQEIIRSASIINTFLSVVEQGFRSPNYEIRAEAFICWKVLVEIFSQNNELISPKRVKLISIPLRSSQAKTMSAAVNKFKVWWYFLLQLNDNIYNNCEMTFEPFLQFCFGYNKNANQNNNAGGQLKQFKDAKEMAVIGLIEMLGSSHKEIHLLLEKFELDQTEETLITESIMQKSYKYILRACFEATLIIIEQLTNRMKLIELLWRNLISQIIQTKNAEIYKECCIIIKELIQTDYDNSDINIKTDLIQICNIFGTHYAFLMTTFNGNATFDLNKVSETIIDFTDVLLSGGNLYFDINIYKPIIRNIYDIDEYKESTKYWYMIQNLIKNLLNSDEIDNFNNFDIKLEIWKRLSLPIITYLDIKLFEFRLAKKAELINNWLLWPLNKIALTKLSFNCIQNYWVFFDDDFFNVWKKIMVSSSKAEGRSNFQIAVFEKFYDFVENRSKIPKCQEVLGCYISCCEKKFDSTTAPKEVIALMTRFLTKPPCKNENYNKIIEYINEYLSSLEESKIAIIFNRIIALTKQIIQAEKMKYITKSCFDNYKKNIIEKLKSDTIDKKFISDFKNILKNVEIYTIIPKIWGLNPENLTEHQVEKMKEKKCDIPALYNDINSHSEDASNSIKPWTPNKIVISKNKDIEQVVLQGRSEVIINSPRESKTSLISDDFKTPKPVDSIIKAYCEISDTNDSSSTLTDKSLKIIDTKNKTVSPGKNKKLPKKKLNSTKLTKITKKDELLLKQMNIQVDDNKKKLAILRNLKAISIDTVEGNAIYKASRKSISDDVAPGIVTRRSEKDKNIIKLSDKNTFYKTRRKSLLDDVPSDIESRTSEKDKNIIKLRHNNGNKPKKNLKATRKSLNFPNINPGSINLDSDKQLLSKKSNMSLNNSDDDIVVSSQISESLISRRVRKSSSSLSNINQDSKITFVTEPTEATDPIINYSRESVIDVVTDEEKMQNKNRPIILGNELIKLSEMDTQLNTENVSIFDLNTTTKQSALKSVLKSLQNNQLILPSPDRQHKKNSIFEMKHEPHPNEVSSSSSALSNNVAHELFIGKFKINGSLKKSPQSESVKELKSLLNKSPKMENEQQSCSSLNNSNKIEELQPLTLQNSPTQKEDLKKISELEIQPNTEEILNNSLSENDKQIANEPEMPITPKHRKINIEIIEETVIKSPVYSPIKPIKKTSNFLDKTNNTSVTSPTCEDTNKKNAHLLNESPINKSLKLLDEPLEINFCRPQEENTSIVTSPEYTNINKRNAEFLNNTLNISPIQITPYKCNIEKDASAEETEIGDDFIKTKDFADLIEKQQLSPIKKINKPAAPLASPPDRKSTNNASSPGPKPKQATPNLTGRGAQFINMIRNRKMISPTKRLSNTLTNTRNDDNNAENNMQSSSTTDNDTGIVFFSASMVPVTPQQLPRDLLVFSKILPSPYASPSASILKRKCCNDTIDDFESPANKRKRVSFHDPPVSVTKEYVKNDGEESSKFSVRTALNKFLQSSTPQTSQQNINSNIQLQNSSKHALKRKSRADSMMELLRFNESPNQKKLSQSKISTAQITTQLQENSEVNNSSNIQKQTSVDNMDTFKWKTTNEMSTTKPPIIQSSPSSLSTTTLNNETEKMSVISVQQLQDDYETSLTPSPQIYFPDEAAIFKHVFDKYTIDDIFEKYCENGYDKTITYKNIRNIIKEISTKMETDDKIKSNVLEMLSEKHPKEFLDHAIQENLSSVVCDRLNSSSVIDFVFEKAKVNTGVKKIVFEKMDSIVSIDRFTRERHDFFMTMLRNEKLTNDEILECIEIISSKRTRNMNGGRGDGAVVSTSETVDSSSIY